LRDATCEEEHNETVSPTVALGKEAFPCAALCAAPGEQPALKRAGKRRMDAAVEKAREGLFNGLLLEAGAVAAQAFGSPGGASIG